MVLNSLRLVFFFQPHHHRGEERDVEAIHCELNLLLPKPHSWDSTPSVQYIELLWKS